MPDYYCINILPDDLKQNSKFKDITLIKDYNTLTRIKNAVEKTLTVEGDSKLAQITNVAAQAAAGTVKFIADVVVAGFKDTDPPPPDISLIGICHLWIFVLNFVNLSFPCIEAAMIK